MSWYSFYYKISLLRCPIVSYCPPAFRFEPPDEAYRDRYRISPWKLPSRNFCHIINSPTRAYLTGIAYMSHLCCSLVVIFYILQHIEVSRRVYRHSDPASIIQSCQIFADNAYMVLRFAFVIILHTHHALLIYDFSRLRDNFMMAALWPSVILFH